jgi:hypothetical protein
LVLVFVFVFVFFLVFVLFFAFGLSASDRSLLLKQVWVCTFQKKEKKYSDAVDGFAQW